MQNKCDSCSRIDVHFYYNSDTRLWVCKSCYVKPPAMYLSNVTVELKNGDTISSAHLRDIMSREAKPDGSVIRKTGKVYI